ncbi:hypothetical protein CY34DRAFT_431004 [Suillus luteus UH-Slu-Lm8-n1]|uniref:Uncharacterized protein n=1 Tax=Suillus luteus UH-Slu-Lm8-n1 TaxID=930992 RepID=A0A0D0BHE9_9AGAM|nr:hypothetical protein CY34DRAFT_431004 [Suillus luteus UH-Slu-Lm8-n1]
MMMVCVGYRSCGSRSRRWSPRLSIRWNNGDDDGNQSTRICGRGTSPFGQHSWHEYASAECRRLSKPWRKNLGIRVAE